MAGNAAAPLTRRLSKGKCDPKGQTGKNEHKMTKFKYDIIFIWPAAMRHEFATRTTITATPATPW